MSLIGASPARDSAAVFLDSSDLGAFVPVACGTMVVSLGDVWSIEPGMAATTREMVDRLLADRRVELPVALVIDAGVIRGVGPAVVEANEASGSGIYGSDPRDVLEALRAATLKPSGGLRPPSESR